MTFLSLSLVYFSFPRHLKIGNWKNSWQEIIKDKLSIFVLVLLTLQILINFLGAISPELSFDALWYHLTPAKLYVQYQQIFHLPGWLLSVSSLPRFTEMFYTAALVLGNEIWAKLIHFSFGILAALVLFNLLKRYFSLRISLLGILTFYTMLVVGWLSTTAYVDLAWTFLTILALDYFLQWTEKKKDILLYQSAIISGLGLATKIFALGSIFVFLFLILVLKNKAGLKRLVIFCLLAFFMVSPWLVLSWVNVGNPIFPLFGSPKDIQAINFQPSSSLIASRLTNSPLFLWRATFKPDDIISPIYLLFLPLVVWIIFRQKPAIKIAAWYCFLNLFLIPPVSGRYLLPLLAVFTLPTLSVLDYPWKNKSIITMLTFVILFSVIINMVGRGLATKKFVPYLLKQETKAEFLAKNLNFSFGEFADVDGYFAKNIKNDDLVLIYGIHNLFYVDFPYVHESWVKPGTSFTHILVGGNQNLPEKFGRRLLIYENPETRVKLYIFGEKYQ